MFRRRPIRSSSVSSLELHPNRAEIVGILSRVPELTDRDLTGLAGAWRDTAYLSVARDHALAPDSPLIIEVLTAFEHVDAVFNEELSAGTIDDVRSSDGSDTTVKPQVLNVALKAVRDTLAAAYAKPALTRSEYAALMIPWRRVVAPVG